MLFTSLVKRPSIWVPCVVLILLLTECVSSPVELLKGIYTTLISAADDQVNGLSQPGRWDLELGDDNRFTVFRDSEVVVEGRYAVKEDQLEFTDEEGPLACQNGQATGSYGWSLDGKTLTLRLVDDGCEGRKAVLATQSFTKLVELPRR